MGKYSAGLPPPEMLAVANGVLAESEEGSGRVGVLGDATVIVFDESDTERLVAVEVAEMEMVYAPLSTYVPAVFVPSHTFGAGFVTLELVYRDFIVAPFAEIILIDVFTDSEKAISIAVVVAKPDPFTAVG